MNIKVYFFLFPVYVYANIQIEIEAAEKLEESKVNIVGTDVAPISSKEELTFQVYEEKLKEAIRTYDGRKPEHVFVRGPTPWNLYRVYGWEEVERVLTPIAARVVSITKEPVLISRQELHNTGPVTAIFTAGMTQNIETTVSTSWNKGGELNAGIEISVGVSFLVAHLSATTRIGYSSYWGTNSAYSKTVTVGSSSTVEVELQPNQTAHVDLTATKGTLKVEVEYQATLQGYVASKHVRRHKDHNYWAYYITALQDAAQLPKAVSSKATIAVGLYLDAKVELRR